MLPIEQVKEQILKLQDHMNRQLPDFPNILNQIHSQLKKEPQLLYMLDDEEIAKVVGGLEKFHQVEVSEPRMKKTVTAKQGRMLSADDV